MVVPVGVGEEGEEVGGEIRWERVQGGEGSGEVEEQKGFSGDGEEGQKSHLGAWKSGGARSMNEPC